MRRCLIVILASLAAISLIGCSTQVPGTVDSKTKIEHGENNMIELGNDLWYDSVTGIVYWWNGNLSRGESATAPTPYYASNGLPYRYNPEKQTFEEIDIKGE